MNKGIDVGVEIVDIGTEGIKTVVGGCGKVNECSDIFVGWLRRWWTFAGGVLNFRRHSKNIMFETEVTVQPNETHTTEDVGVDDLSKPTYESESINGVDVNVECEKDEVNNENILGKVFDTFDDAYSFYNDYAFLHGFGIASRIKSSLEVPKKRTCSYYQGLGHYATGCSKRKVLTE
ncbi:hypothetical protein LXL04_008544 [Taraxacum kok-saghyz]